MERAFGLEIPVALEDLCDPRRGGGFAYDMPGGKGPPTPNGAEVPDRVVNVLAAARDGGYRVFFTRHMGLPHAVAGASQLRTAMAWQRVDRVGKRAPRFPPPFSRSG